MRVLFLATALWVKLPERQHLPHIVTNTYTTKVTCDIITRTIVGYVYILRPFWAATDLSFGVSTKMDFGEEEEVVTNSSHFGDDDVEVKHTIVVSTKLKNNNRRGVTSNKGDTGTLTYSIGDGTKTAKEDSGEVPVYKSYQSVETTRIRTPDSRYKTKVYPDAIFVSRNIRNENDVYPFVATNPMQWKPVNFYSNINHANPDGSYSIDARKRQDNNIKFHRKITDEGAREFYCQKCLELSNAQDFRGCTGTYRNPGVQQRSANTLVRQTTTPKIDGKLMKLN